MVTELEHKYAEPITSTQEQSMPFVEIPMSIHELKQKLFSPYDLQNNSQELAQFFRFNPDDDYIFK